MSESDDDDAYGPPLPPGMHSGKDSDDQYGPALPPASRDEGTSQQANIIGPAPSHQGRSLKYSSDSESDSSSTSSGSDSDDSSRRRKKRKHKHKKSLKSKHDHRDSEEKQNKPDFIGPVIPSRWNVLSSRDSDGEGSSSIGPVLPPGLRERTENSDSDDGIIGPGVGLQAREEDLSAVHEFEARSQRMKEKLTSNSKTDEAGAEVPMKRESWMTELPEEIGASFGLGNRQFRTKDAPQIDSSWTDAPHEKGKHKEVKKRKEGKEEYFQSAEDQKAAKEIKEYNKKNRPESLLEMHKKELKKKKKEKKKDKTTERRPFDRDVDLKVNRFDNAMKQAYIKRSQELNTRFSSGGTGTSFL